MFEYNYLKQTIINTNEREIHTIFFIIIYNCDEKVQEMCSIFYIPYALKTFQLY